MSLPYWVGIDLGSTTTKAVLLDGDGRVIGRGITNSRSNYDVACQVALAEGLADARLARLARELGEPEGEEEHSERMQRISLALRHRQFLDNLEALHEVLLRLCAEKGLDDGWRDAVGGILAAMERESAALFVPGAERKSDFFRDLAGSMYMRLAEATAEERGLPYEQVLGLYDKGILEVENRTPSDETFRRNLVRAAETGGFDAEMSDAARRAAGLELVQAGSVGTGYGRARLPFPRKQIRSEILCHGLGAHAMFPGTRTVLDIGGQDTKAIQVDGAGIVTSFQMNDRCAAGCGRYLGYIADEMNLGLHELGPLASKSRKCVKINSTCTVFAGAELRERLSLGERREDILAGLHRAIILRAMSLLARSGGIEEEFTFTGGVARNPAAVEALQKLVAENYGDRTLNISPSSIYTGALGAALFALRDKDAVVEAA
ncbi:MAG: BadF/BadG/BcrA/BcrD ATPase family protein [Planctomycetota bacterium]